jgi:RecA-family ATPase
MMAEIIPIAAASKAVKRQILSAPAPRPAVILSPLDFRGVRPPERTWIVPDWIPAGVVTGFYGDGGLGKSLLSQQLQTCTAIGRPWMGLPVMGKIASLGVYCEDPRDEILRRQAGINAAYSCEDSSDLARVHWMPRFGEDNLLMTFQRGVGTLTPFHAQVMQAALDVKARLVIIDTAADVFGGNENQRGQVRQFVQRALGSIAAAINGAVVLCAHPSRSGLSSGEGDGASTGWNNTFRSRMYLSEPKTERGETIDDKARVLTRKKANYGPRHEEIRLRWQDGIIVRDRGASLSSIAADRRPANDVFLDLLDERNKTGRPVSAKKRASNYGPKDFMGFPAEKRENYITRNFETAMESLFAPRSIEIETYGKKSNLCEKIVRSGTVGTIGNGQTTVPALAA